MTIKFRSALCGGASVAAVLLAMSSQGASAQTVQPPQVPLSDTVCPINALPVLPPCITLGTRTTGTATVTATPVNGTTSTVTATQNVVYSGDLAISGQPVTLNPVFGPFQWDAATFFDPAIAVVNVDADYDGTLNFNAPNSSVTSLVNTLSNNPIAAFSSYSFNSNTVNSISVNVQEGSITDQVTNLDYFYSLTAPDPTAISTNASGVASVGLQGRFQSDTSEGGAIVFGRLTGDAALLTANGAPLLTPTSVILDANGNPTGGWISPYALQYNVTAAVTTQLDENGLITPTVSVTDGIEMNGSRITNLADGIDQQDAATVAQVNIVANTANSAYNVALFADTRAVNAANLAQQALTAASICTEIFGTNLRCGTNATAGGQFSLALGYGAISNGSGSVAIGFNSVANEFNVISVGNAANQRRIVNVAMGIGDFDAVNVSQMNGAINAATQNSNIRINNTLSGPPTVASAQGAIAIGFTTQATGSNSVSLGTGSNASGNRSIAILGAAGNEAIAIGGGAGGSRATAIGQGAFGNSSNSVAIGSGAVSGNIFYPGSIIPVFDGEIAIGQNASAGGTGSVAIGQGSAVTNSGLNSVAIGASTRADRQNVVAVGNAAGTLRQVVGVAAGTEATDAVNFGQLNAVSTTANTALTNAATAQSTANTALTNAATAQTTANTALTNAATAQATANQALAQTGQALTSLTTLTGDVTTALSAANNAQTAAANAQTVATSAQNTANTAITNAEAAQTTANTALANAGTAQTTANTALTNAATAQTTADNAQSTANQALSVANQALTQSGSVTLGTGNGSLQSVGGGSTANGNGAVSLGLGNQANGNGAVAIGDPNIATGTGAVAMGADNTATGDGAVAIGNLSIANGAGNVALGNGAQANASNSVALGGGSVASQANTVSVGATGSERRIVNVAVGTAASDAATVGQLNGAIQTESQTRTQQMLQVNQRIAVEEAARASLGTALTTETNARLAADISLSGRIDGLSAQLSQIDSRLTGFENKIASGTAVATAMGGAAFLPDMKFNLTANVATYDGAHAGALQMGALVTPNVAINAGVATGFNKRGKTAARVGVTVGW
ncbi:MAG: YadA family autotransporter adhesin [Sphingorhabdus sp.]